MINRFCLFIDDGPDIDSVIERLSKAGKAKGLHIEYDTFNPMDAKFRDKEKDMDIDKVVDALQAKYLNRKIDLIACDFNLGDKRFYGNDILKKVRHLDGFCTLVIYSGNLQAILGHILKDHDPERAKNTLKKLQGIVNARIEKFIDKDEHLVDQIVALLIITPLELVVVEKLLDYKDMEFKGTFPAFQGMKLGEIANHIRKNTVEGKNFSSEIIEQVIATLIDVAEHE